MSPPFSQFIVIPLRFLRLVVLLLRAPRFLSFWAVSLTLAVTLGSLIDPSKTR
jgi:hypothetical protein